MKSRTVPLAILLLLLLLPATQALTITMEGPITLHGGGNYTYFINVTAETPTHVSLTPHIYPNDTGFTTSFSEQPFIARNTKTVLLNVTTSPYLIGTYTISVTYSSSSVENNEPKQKTGTVETSNPIIIEEPKDQDDNDTSPTEPSDNETDTNTTDNTTDDTNITILPEQPEPFPTIYIYITIAIIFVATVLILFYLYKRQEKEK
jgi:hypothetical protein